MPTLLAPDSTPAAEQLERELLIREARRRQRRRWLALVSALVVIAAGAYAGVSSFGSAPLSGSLLSRPLHFPALGPGGRCPVSAGYPFKTAYFGGPALGHGPVRVLITNAGDDLHGRPNLGRTDARGWYALQTIWFAMPRYDGPFVVRARRLGKPGPIAVQSGGTPDRGPLVVSAGPTANTFYSNWRQGRVRDPVTGRLVPTLTGYGYRTVPVGTWVRSPGCYGWQVDGRGFSEVIVFDAQAAGS